MSTTGKNFISIESGGAAAAVSPKLAAEMKAGLAGTAILDKIMVDLSAATWAKNGCTVLTLVASTPQTVDVTALSVAAAGDSSFATVNEWIAVNLGAHDATISPGGSNPFAGPIVGSFILPAGSAQRFHSAAGWTADGTHKNVTVDPGTNAGIVGFCFGGA